jgi:hypothetical protein
MGKNREESTELSACIVDIITMLQEEISRHCAEAASRQRADPHNFVSSSRGLYPGLLFMKLTQPIICSLLLEIQQGLGRFQKTGFRTRFKAFGRSMSIGDELKKFKGRVQELQLDFIEHHSLPLEPFY